ncbi:MAG: conjugative transposon protein TraM [Puia sp.]
MNHPQTSLKLEKQRKFMLLLPLLALPFIIILFFILGGGKGSGTSLANQQTGGLNLKLPDPHFKKGRDKSKMSIYEEASKDSAILKEKMKTDPYYLRENQGPELMDSIHLNLQDFLKHKPGSKGLNEFTTETPDENESKIMDKLAKLKSIINQKTEDPPSRSLTVPSNQKNEQLEKLMSNLNGSHVHDERIDQLSGILDKAFALQHPEIVRDSLYRMASEQKQSAFSVTRNNETSEPETFGSTYENEDAGQNLGNRFYDLTEGALNNSQPGNTIEAVIPETQVLVSGSTIKLRLLNDIRINGHLIEKNQFIFGTTTLNNERLKIGFSSVRSGNNIFPVSLEAYDLDGLAGIFIPGSMDRDVVKQSGDQAINSIGLTSLDPSIGAQAAGAGIQAAKTLLSRKVKLVKVTVKEGYRVLLKDSKQK